MARQAKPWFWKARRAWFVTVAGVRHRLGADKESALRVFRELKMRPVATHSAGDSLAVVIDAFLDWAKTHRSPDTFEWYRYRLQRFVDRNPKMRTSELKPFHVQQWVDSYPKFSQTSRRNYLRSMKRCLIWAKKQGYTDGNPIEHLEVPGAERREVLISATEFGSFLSHVSDESFRDLLVVTWESGCRPQESLRVEARHVEMANRRWVFPVKESKGSRSRIVAAGQPEGGPCRRFEATRTDQSNQSRATHGPNDMAGKQRRQSFDQLRFQSHRSPRVA